MGLSKDSTGLRAAQTELVIHRREPSDQVVALCGNPNVGKSTVFNALTGLRQHTGNWPGKTVTNAQGCCTHKGRGYVLVDLPGCYSLQAHSAEEEAARDFLCFGGADCAAVVCDATCLERNLNLVLQVLEITPRTVVCVNLLDEARRKGVEVDLPALSRMLGVPVVGASARAGEGLDQLMDCLEQAALNDPTPRESPPVSYGQSVEALIARLMPACKRLCAGKLEPRWLALRLLDGVDESLTRSLGKALGTEPAKDPEVSAVLAEIGPDFQRVRDQMAACTVRRGEKIARAVTKNSAAGYSLRDRKIDRVLTSPLTGIPVMLLMLLGIFWLTIAGANYPSRLLSQGLFWLGDWLKGALASLGAAEWLVGLLCDGMYKTLAWVVAVMLPPMAIFFPLFTLLEDLGYLPRVAFNMDRCFQSCGACGKQALTTWMGYISLQVDGPGKRCYTILVYFSGGAGHTGAGSQHRRQMLQAGALPVRALPPNLRRSTMKERAPKPVGFVLSAAMFLALIALVVSFTALLGAAPHVPLLLAAVLAAIVGAFHHYKWQDMLDGIGQAVTPALPALLIIMSIGILIAAWMAGGIIPTMVYYGLRIISPRFFLVTALLLCSLVSLAIGSSLSTIGTVGVALFGIGEAIGIPGPITVGAIVSGAYFGDKMSPLSDTTNLAPSVSDTNVFDHIRHMMVTTTPTYLICIVIYGILGFVFGGGSADNAQVQETLSTLAANFTIHPLLLLPPLLVLVMVILRIPALPGLLGAALLGMLSALFIQGADMASILGGVMNGFSAQTGVDTVDTLLNRGGILSMMRTVALMIIALSFAGIFECTGMAGAILKKVVSHVKSDKGLVIATILTAWGVLIGTGQQYVAIIMTGRLFRPLYKEHGLAPQNLSRALEDAGTVFGGIVPYSTGAGFTENMLGVSAWQYGPFTFFGWLNPLVAITIAALGRSMPKSQPDVPVPHHKERKKKKR